jgi:hypothetical protein
MMTSSALLGLLVTVLSLCGGYALSAERTRVGRAMIGLVLTTSALLSLVFGQDFLLNITLFWADMFVDTGSVPVQGVIGIGMIMIAINLLDAITRPSLHIRHNDPAAVAMSGVNRWLARGGVFVMCVYMLTAGVSLIPSLRILW